MAAPKAEDKKKARSKRVPLGVPRLKMAVEGKPGFKRRWVNDVGGRLTQAEEGGYNFVKRDDAGYKEHDTANRNDGIGDHFSKTVNSDGTKAYLMEIPISMFNSDQLVKADAIDDTENGLRQGDDSHGREGSDGRYIPREGIKID